MSVGNWRALEWAASLAVILHLALFAAFRPAPARGPSGGLVPPRTQYLAKASGTLPINEVDARLVWSPLLFSFPSEKGFSKVSLTKRPHTPTIDLSPSELGSFLELKAFSYPVDRQVMSQTRKLIAEIKPAPQLPAREYKSLGKPPSARRVYVAPELKERLVGGIVLPPELNKEVGTAWEVHASISISEQGEVRHVFLDHPLESPELNRQVQRLFRSLRFKPGNSPVDGRIEIYSPEIRAGEEGQS